MSRENYRAGRITNEEIQDLIKKITGLKVKQHQVVRLLKKPHHSKYFINRVYMMAYLCSVAYQIHTVDLFNLTSRERHVLRTSANMTFQLFKEEDLRYYSKIILQKASLFRKVKND